MLRWGNWRAGDDATVSPYVDWFKLTQLAPDAPECGFCTSLLPPAKGAPEVAGLEPAEVPLPRFALPPEGAPVAGADPVWPQPRPDAVIVGVIDSGLALAHARFRHGDGSSRILSAWQQGAEWQGQPVPFGHVLRKPAIDALMQAATVGGVVDEASFNHAAGLARFDHPHGAREVERAASHGTHVMDLAAGVDPSQPDPDNLGDRLAIIAVTLPPRPTIGASGNFLEFFVIHALQHIVDTADAIWQAHYVGEVAGAFGFPIVINLSYGLQAGPKDGQMAVERYIAALVDQRRAAGRAPLRIVIAAGNDNLEQGQARVQVRPAGSDPLTWRLVPGDLTPNHLEVWTDPLPASAQAHPFALQITPPGAMPQRLAAGMPGQVCDLADDINPTRVLARIYCQSMLNAQTGTRRFSYVICTRPTLDHATTTTPAGAWVLRLYGPKTKAQLFIQSDQSLIHGAATGLLSYFDDPEYQPHDEAGCIIDQCDFPPPGQPPQPRDTGAVGRANTLNAIASLPECIVVAGYRASDGRPAPYSSAGRGDAPGIGRQGPTVAFPSDDGAAHFGLLGAGAKSGSVVAFQGTSFATALATRTVALDLLGWRRDQPDHAAGPGSAAWLAASATLHEMGQPFAGVASFAKIGAGRLKAPASDRIARVERE